MYDGEEGPATAMAMRIVVGAARAMDAPALLPISAAHVDSCLHHGPSSLEFAARLVEGEGVVRVPTTLNVGGLDLMRPNSFRGTAADADARRELMTLYTTLGAAPTFTCAPYQLPGRPLQGDHIAWAESNAIVFANSVIGAKTNRYGDLIDIAAALTGLVPHAGLHLDENRAAQAVFDVLPETVDQTDDDLLPALLGHHVGRRTGSLIPVLTGIDPDWFDEDWGKAFGAAAAASGGVALFHVVECTPEARDLHTALQGGEPVLRRQVSAADLRRGHAELCTAATDATLGAVSLGTPHMSLDQIRGVADALRGRSVVIPTFVSTARSIAAADRGAVADLEAAGVSLVTDTCTYISPIIGQSGVVMTNSAKWAYYAPASLGVDVVLASQDDCLRSALTGRIHVGGFR